MIDYRVYLVTDNPSRYAGNWLDNVRAAVEGGVTCVQYRDTESPAKRQYERILALRDAIGRVPIIVNNDAELALAVHADGVHVGQGDLPPTAVRSIVGPGCEIGYSITDACQLEAKSVEIENSDCLGVGPVFDARKTKADAARAMGIDGFLQIAAALPGYPLVAIGGITMQNAADVISAGACGLAVVSAFSKSDNPHAVAKAFRQLFDRRQGTGLHPFGVPPCGIARQLKGFDIKSRDSVAG